MVVSIPAKILNVTNSHSSITSYISGNLSCAKFAVPVTVLITITGIVNQVLETVYCLMSFTM